MMPGSLLYLRSLRWRSSALMAAAQRRWSSGLGALVEKDAVRRLERIARRDAVDQRKVTQLHKESGSLMKIRKIVEELDKVEQSKKELLDMEGESSDENWKEMVKEELSDLRDRWQQLEDEMVTEMTVRVLPEDVTEDGSSVVLEIRPGAGGTEASLFTEELADMYESWCDRQGFDMSVVSSVSGPENKGLREFRAEVSGKDVFELLRHEAGVHRVQRIPKTESSGRIHTSTASVSVLPTTLRGVEDVELKESDCKIEATRSSGPGGQHVNTTDTAIRIVHIPTGVVVQNQEERSLLRNRESAMRELKARLQALKVAEAYEKVVDARRSQLGVTAGERSDKIRTYNFQQNRVTDHRLQGFSLLNRLEDFLSGEEPMDETIEKLRSWHMNTELSLALDRLEEN